MTPKMEKSMGRVLDEIFDKHEGEQPDFTDEVDMENGFVFDVEPDDLEEPIW